MTVGGVYRWPEIALFLPRQFLHFLPSDLCWFLWVKGGGLSRVFNPQKTAGSTCARTHTHSPGNAVAVVRKGAEGKAEK